MKTLLSLISVAISARLALAQTASLYGQCGGIGWTGATACPAGSYCQQWNDWYFQCVPGTASSSASSTSSSSSSTSRSSSSSTSSTRSSSSSTSTSSTSSSSSSTRSSTSSVTSTSSSSSASSTATGSVTSETQTWKNVVIGAGGFVPGIVFNPTQKGLCYLRTDIGGLYRLNTADDSWIPLTDYAGDADWHDWGIDAVATDPVQPNNVYVAVGMYTNSWDPNNGSILKSTDQGSTWTKYSLPFKVGGNMPGRGMGERLAIDPNNNSILYFGARSGNGLYKSTNAGASWSKVSSFPDPGTYIPDPSDPYGYNTDIVGLTWVTFDPSLKTSSGTSRIFVGVASLGKANVYQTTDGGSSWSALPIFNSTLIPHKGILSPSESSLYVTFANGAGPYDGTAGRVGKYNITAGTWKDITPPQAITDNYYGFGGLAVDLQKPGTLMVAALNEWWPDANIYRSLDGGSTWSPLWEWYGYPTINRYFGLDNSLAPYLGGPLSNQDVSLKLVGWMIETLNIDPFDSNHWLYGTGATVAGGRDLLKWDSAHNVTIKAYAAGLEETAVLGLISPPSGTAHLLSVVADIGGFLHTSLSTPSKAFATPTYGTTSGIDYAGNKPSQVVRVGNIPADTNPQVALSNDYGATWSIDYAAPIPSSNTGYAGGTIAYSADGDTLLWSTSGKGVQISKYQASFTAVSALPSGAAIASDKVNGTTLYAASGSTFYSSSDTGATWKSATVSGLSSATWITVNPSKAGELWLSGDGGIFHSTNYGSTFTALPSCTRGWKTAAGAPKTTGGTPALYAAATVNGVSSVFRTDDQVNWILITDSAHGFGAASSLVLAADPRIYKRVYIGTNGRGIFYNSNAA